MYYSITVWNINTESTLMFDHFPAHGRTLVSSSISTGCVAPLRGDWAIFCHRRGWQSVISQGKIPQNTPPQPGDEPGPWRGLRPCKKGVYSTNTQPSSLDGCVFNKYTLFSQDQCHRSEPHARWCSNHKKPGVPSELMSHSALEL